VRKILDTTERVVLHPMDMGPEIELIVEIAAMVDLGTNNKTAGLKGSVVPVGYGCGGPQPALSAGPSVADSGA